MDKSIMPISELAGQSAHIADELKGANNFKNCSRMMSEMLHKSRHSMSQVHSSQRKR